MIKKELKKMKKINRKINKWLEKKVNIAYDILLNIGIFAFCGWCIVELINYTINNYLIK